MPFDPDAYLAEVKKSPPDFDPDEYLASVRVTPEGARAAQLARRKSGEDVFVGRSEFDLAKDTREKPTWLDTGMEMALEGGAGTVGQVVGGPVGGALLQGAANTTNQLRRMAKGQQEGFRVGELTSDMALGLVPGAPAVKAGGMKALNTGIGALGKEALKQGAAGYAAGNVQSLIDEGRLMSPKESLFATAIPAAGGALAHKLLTSAPSTAAALEEARGRQSQRSKTVDAARELDLNILPTTTDPSFKNKQLESLAGSADRKRVIQKSNVEGVDNAFKDQMGIPREMDISPEVLQEIRRQKGQIYEEIRGLTTKAEQDLTDFETRTFGPAQSDPHQLAVLQSDPAVKRVWEDLQTKAAGSVDKLKQLRADTQDAFNSYYRSEVKDPAKLDEAHALADQASDMAEKIEDSLKAMGKPEMADQLAANRKAIAQTYDVEKALNPGDYSVSARKIGQRFKEGKTSGAAEVVGRAQRSFRESFRDQSELSSEGVEKLGLWARGVLGIQALKTGHPIAAAATFFGPPVISGMAQNRILSPSVQEAAAAALRPKVHLDPRELLLSTATRMGSQQAGQPQRVLQSYEKPNVDAIKDLMDDPSLANQFDEMYGPGSAERWLRRG